MFLVQVERASSPRVYVVHYHCDFQFVMLSQGIQLGALPLTFNGEHLWVVAGADQRDTPRSSNSDTILVLDLAGSRIRTLWTPDRHIIGLAYGRNHIWIHSSRDPHTIAEMNTAGKIVSAFTVPGDPEEIAAFLAWGDESLWVLNRYEQRVLGIDAVASVDSGYAVVDRGFSVPARLTYPHGMTSDGDYLCIIAADSLYRYTFEGEYAESWSLPVALAGGITWDGEAMWIVHHGPRDFDGCWTSNAPLLSRFELP